MSHHRERAGSASPIAAALLAGDAEQRRQATSHLAELELPEALPLLLRALGDADWRVRKEATIAARSFVPDRALINALITALGQGDNVGLRNAAVEVLAIAGHAAAPAIADAMSALDEVGRKLAVEALGRSRDEAALGPLEAALFDPDDNVRQAAVEAIATVGAVAGEPAHKILIRCLSDEDRFIRLTALEGLSSLGVAVPWRRLEPLLADPTSRTAALMAAALAEHPQAPSALAHALKHARGGSFAQTLSALAKLAEGPLSGAVGKAIRDQGPELLDRLTRIASGEGGEPEHLRASALILSALVACPGCVEAAILALGEQTLAPAAQRALISLGPAALPALIAQIAPPPPDALSPAYASPLADELAQTQVRATAVDVAVAIVTEQTEASSDKLPDLLTALRAASCDRDKDVVTSALYALSHLGAEADLALAAELTLSPDVSIASAAEATLTSLVGRHPAAARALAADLAKREVFWLPSAVILGALGAADAIEASGLREAVGFLSHCAASGDARTRRAAVLSVSQIGGPLASDVLSLALADEERDVQLEAARALGRLCTDPSVSRFLDSSPPSGPPSSEKPRNVTTDVLELIGRSGDSDLVAVAVSALGDGITSWGPPSIPPSSARGNRHSVLPPDDLIHALTPLAAKAPSSVAIAAVDAVSRAPLGTPGRTTALMGALGHTDAAVTKAAMLKLEVTDATADRIARCLDHPAHDVRLLAVERLAEASFRGLRARFARRAVAEPDPEVREAIERAIAAIDRRAGGPTEP
ncbi:MAG TPA: HEAT repeat domain-containing protein [Polyangiaceae bacterium]|nr:HEAT repeat domain-containing protein [Polyangiaceae bacterium]